MSRVILRDVGSWF